MANQIPSKQKIVTRNVSEGAPEKTFEGTPSFGDSDGTSGSSSDKKPQNHDGAIMTEANFIEDFTYLVDHIFRGSDAAVSRWSSVKCDDSQLVIVCAITLLANYYTMGAHKRHSKLGNSCISTAAAEIVEKSGLNFVLEVDRASNCIRIREDAQEELLFKASDIFCANSSGTGPRPD